MRPEESELIALSAQTGALLESSGRMLVTAESCTGGWVGKVLTDTPGSSAWYVGGLITYNNAMKQVLLGVLADTLNTHGAVSEPVVREMAHGAMECSEANIALAISGVAGPGGGTAEKPVGLVCIGWLLDDGTALQTTCRFPGDREEVRARAVAAALRGLIELLS